MYREEDRENSFSILFTQSCNLHLIQWQTIKQYGVTNIKIGRKSNKQMFYGIVCNQTSRRNNNIYMSRKVVPWAPRHRRRGL